MVNLVDLYEHRMLYRQISQAKGLKPWVGWASPNPRLKTLRMAFSALGTKAQDLRVEVARVGEPFLRVSSLCWLRI
ncbi:hypothetical protein CRG98_047747 [Punica granatum]|uniref:Uncharacterized protein n=1 Tax=Punica granatum TaxID=22663 RepID=A0A2I0HJK9_PUNGR|nr:hypothetical protein CRG98_047747 [Punica granatum]